MTTCRSPTTVAELGYTTAARMGCEPDVWRQIRPRYFGQYEPMLAPTKNPASIGVQVAADQHVLVVHHVLGDLTRRLALIKFCASHMTGRDHDVR